MSGTNRYCSNTAVMAVSAALVIAVMPLAAAPPENGDAAAGKTVFARCAGCHATKPGVRSIGPNLAGVQGRKIASRPGFDYSPALVRAKGTWDRSTLDRFLTSPLKFAPGSRMAFSGIADAKQRADLIAYLATVEK